VVVGCARDGQRLNLVAAELPGLVAVRCDVRESGEGAALVQTALDRFGRVDVLVHNAGLGYVGAVADMTAEDVERIIDTNVTGTSTNICRGGRALSSTRSLANPAAVHQYIDDRPGSA
jgi:NAD(P)-dependent dehydrogenase (short-subunit alcohol dehydrogenase family)